jgi:Xaa-Pro aminopeptidase
MDDLGIRLLYLSPGANAYYLTGWRRRPPTYGNIVRNGGWVEGLVIGLSGQPALVVPRMIKDFWLKQDLGLDVRVLPDLAEPVEFLRHTFETLERGSGTIAIEDRAPAELVLGVQTARPGAPTVLASTVLSEMRMRKSEEELQLMTRAGEIVERTMDDITGYLRPGTGQTELDVCWEIDRLMVKHGAFWPSFTTNAWQMGPLEHRPLTEKASSRPLEYGNALLFDFGSVFDEYCYDFGRTVFLGEPTAEYLQIHELVIESQRVGIESLRAGTRTAAAVDAMARAVIAEAGYGDHFTHRLGHGIGLDVHEPPFLDAGDERYVETGMCFTVEPSIFMPGRLGSRVEDVVLVTPKGGEPLTKYDRGPRVVN